MHAVSLMVRMEVIPNDATRKGKIGKMQESTLMINSRKIPPSQEAFTMTGCINSFVYIQVSCVIDKHVFEVTKQKI